MDSTKKRNIFLLIIAFLVIVLVAVSAITLAQGPRDTLVELVSNNGTTDRTVKDLYDGEMTIPYFDIPGSQYKPDQFLERNGIITYEGGDSFVGINVNEQMGEIDWNQVAESGVDYALIRVGYREYKTGKIVSDSNFEANIQGAIDAGLPVGAYFFSKAVTDAEAEEEANFVLEKIRGYTVTYPLAYYWTYGINDDGSKNQDDRTIRCNGDQITGFIGTFCQKASAAGYTASYYCDKSMGYESLDLEALRDYDMWYAEYREVPSFYYNFTIWQYTKEGKVPGIEKDVPIDLALKKYGS